jgi:hypothetical protein
MYVINRAVAVIKPKQPFVDWINSHPDSAEDPVALEQVRQDCNVFLIPDFDSEEEVEEYIEDLSTDIFEIELESWYTDEESWPTNRDFQTFREWFDVEVHSMVIDPYEDRIEREELY